MKRKVAKLFILVIVFFSLGTYAFKHDYFTVHGLSVGDVYGDCPLCSSLTPPHLGTVVVAAINSDATCTSDQVVSVMCNTPGCSHNATVTVAGTALGHSVVTNVTNSATCTSQGSQTRTCSRCGTNLGSSNIPALGHNHVTTVTANATCLSNGSATHTCSRCGNSYQTTINALGHNYTKVITKQATCTEDGLETNTCTRCGDKNTATIQKLGHDYVEERVEPTCTEDGHVHETCRRCNDEKKVVLKALGHKLDEGKTSKEATCEEDGLKICHCERCDEDVEVVLPKLGHEYPEEWSVEKEPSYVSTGLETKTCKTCQEKISQEIPRKNPIPLVIAGTGAIALVGAAFFFFKKNGLPITKEKIVDGPDKFKPSVEDKSVVVCSLNEELIKLLKRQHYLEVSTSDFEGFKESVVENEPDIAICDIEDDNQLSTILELKNDDLAEQNIGLVLPEELIQNNKEELDRLVKEKALINYVPKGTNNYGILVKLMLPLLKPNFKSDESLDNMGQIADLLGIPGISTVINVFVSGRDIKATLEEGELGISEKATIISDIASILGFDQVASVAGLVDDVESIKGAFEEESGAYEKKQGVSAGKDIVDVVSDIIDK